LGAEDDMSNPFAILAVDPAATKREVLAQVAAALREGRHEARAIAEAQKTLFDPIARAVAEFEYTLDPCGDSADILPERVKEGTRPALTLLC
jgi:hypothetical protein